MSTKRTLLVGGIEVNVFEHQEQLPDRAKDAVIFFYLHGRGGSADGDEHHARHFVETVAHLDGEKRKRFIFVTFDHRNHGKRLVHEHANKGWNGKDESKNNDTHAVDMWAIQYGSAKDVSFLIDVLPSFIFPDDESLPSIEWGLVGKSLGGHSTWIGAAQDSRIKTAIPIIGCPDYHKLMTDRAAKKGLPTDRAPYFPASFREMLKRFDVASICAQGAKPFLGKRILILSGGDDKLVPYSAGKHFIDNILDVGDDGIKQSIIYEGVGHECTSQMIDDGAAFVVKYCM